jgi:uncharacterized repeat protein (TIGR01451 family)
LVPALCAPALGLALVPPAIGAGPVGIGASDRASASLHVGGSETAVPGLVLRNRASRSTVGPGGPVRFTITVATRGAGVARNLTVCNRMPAGLSIVRTPTVRRESARTCWRISRISSGERKRFTLLARADRVSRPRTTFNVAILDGPGVRRRAAAVVAILPVPARSPAVAG